MTKTLKNFFDSFLSTTIYKYTLLFLVLINTLPFIKPVTEEANKVFLIWGIIILIKDFFTKKRLFKNKVHLLLWLFMAFYAITVIVNYKHNLFANIVVMGYCIINYFILYSYEEKDSPTTIGSQMKFINTAFICFSFLTGVFSIIIFFGNISFQYHSIWGTTDSIGTFDGRLWGINGNPNTCGIMSVISIAFSVMELFLKHYKKLFFKIFFIINIVIQYVVLGLTKSRGAQLALIAFVGISLMMGLYLKFIKTKKIKKFAVVLSILIGILGGAAAYGTVEISSPIINFVVIKLNQAHTPTEPPIEEVQRIDLEKSDTSNGRFLLWKAGFEAFEHYPVLGTSHKNVYDFTLDSYSGTLALNGLKGGGMHNVLIQTLVANGLVGLLIFLSIICCFGRLIMKYIKNIPTRENRVAMVFIISILCMFFAHNMVENMIVYSIGWNQTLFWSYLGFCMYFITKDMGLKDKPNFLSRFAERVTAKKNVQPSE